jgi:hypothetical protein
MREADVCPREVRFVGRSAVLGRDSFVADVAYRNSAPSFVREGCTRDMEANSDALPEVATRD